MIGSIGRAALAAALAACIAGCGGGGQSAPVPALAPSTAPGSSSSSSSGSAVYPLSSAGSTFALPSAGAYGGTVTFPAFDVPTGATIAASASTDPPAGLSPAALRRPAVTGTANVYYYVTFISPVTITLPSVPGFSIAIGPSFAAQRADFYYAISEPPASGALASFRTEGPATVTGAHAGFSPSSVPLTLRAGTRYVFAFYSLARVAPRPFVYAANPSVDTVTAYSFDDSGDVAPLFTLAGPATQLNVPMSMARDTHGSLYVGNRGPFATGAVSSITVYASGATDNAAPTRTITGPLTGLVNLRSIAVDASGRVYAVVLGAYRGQAALLVFPPGAAGDVAPVQTIVGLYLPEGIAVDSAGEIVVANDYPTASLQVFAPGANGYAAPIRTVSGPATGLSSPGHIAIDDAAEQMFVVDGESVSVFPLGANGNAAPLARLAGTNTGLENASGVALSGDALVVSDTASSLLEYVRGPLGNIAPLREIIGPNTGLNQPADVTVAP